MTTADRSFYEPVDTYRGFTLARRPDTPNYYITWCPKGQSKYLRRSTRTDNLELAIQRLREHAHRRGVSGPRCPHELGLEEVLCDYANKDGPIDHRRYAIPASMKHLQEFCRREGLVMVADMTCDMQDLYVEWRRDRLVRDGFTGSNGTIKRELGVLKAAIRRAWKRGKLTEVPYIRSVPTPPPRQRFLSEDEAHRLIAACREPHLKLYVLMGLHTLQRPSAILGLTIDQVNVERRLIDFRRPGEAEHNKRRPVVPMTATLRPYLEQAMRDSLSGHVVEFLGRPLKGVRTAFNTARDLAGLGSDVTPYTLRHTGATLMAAKGVSMRQISGMLGHSHSKTTELYAKHAPDFLGEAANALDSLFGEQVLLPPSQSNLTE